MATHTRKLEELVLHIVTRLADEPYAGRSKLMKLVWISDFGYYRMKGLPITGAEWKRMERGPVAIEVFRACETLLFDDRALPESRIHGEVEESRLVPTDQVDRSVFEPGELDFVDKVLDRFGSHTGKQLSDMSHKFDVWKYSADQEVIPYAAFQGEVRDEQIEAARPRAQRLASRLGL